MNDSEADSLLSGGSWAKHSDARELLQEAARIGAQEARDAIAAWLEGQGQPGYAHEVRYRNWT